MSVLPRTGFSSVGVPFVLYDFFFFFSSFFCFDPIPGLRRSIPEHILSHIRLLVAAHVSSFYCSSVSNYFFTILYPIPSRRPLKPYA